MADLRGPIVDALEAIVADIVIERHGDPHVAFLVLAYPDRQPEVITIGQAGYASIQNLVSRGDVEHDDDDEGGGHAPERAMFRPEEVSEAESALNAVAWACRGWRGPTTGFASLGDFMTFAVKQQWDRAREAAADLAAKVLWKEVQPRCPHCKTGFNTERGLNQHLAQAAACSRMEARRQASGTGPDSN